MCKREDKPCKPSKVLKSIGETNLIESMGSYAMLMETWKTLSWDRTQEDVEDIYE